MTLHPDIEHSTGAAGIEGNGAARIDAAGVIGPRPAVPAAGVVHHVTTTVVSTEAGFDALEREWDALLESSDSTVFQSYEWQRTWWKYFGRNDRLRIMVFRDGGQLVGIAPLCLHRSSALGLPFANSLRFIGVPLSDYAEVIMRRGCERRVCEAFASALAATAADWDVFDLEDVNETSASLQLLPDALRARGIAVVMHRGNICPELQLPTRPEDLINELGANMRYNFRRKNKRLQTKFKSEVTLVPDDDGKIHEAIDEFARIHGARWKSQGHPSAFDDPRHREFHNEVSRLFSRRNWLRIYFLNVEGENVACSFSFNYRDRIYMYQSNAHGSEEVMKCSPGMIVRSVAMLDGIREGRKVYDFMRGDEAYKYREWPSTNRRNWLVRASSPRAASRVRYRLFLTAELFLKSGSRIKREWYEYRRFRSSQAGQAGQAGIEESSGSPTSYLRKRAAELARLGWGYVARHTIGREPERNPGQEPERESGRESGGDNQPA
jgi:CelD/BcsL family acetyltransferase involved in cellulose biosynthesis